MAVVVAESCQGEKKKNVLLSKNKMKSAIYLSLLIWILHLSDYTMTSVKPIGTFRNEKGKLGNRGTID